MPSATLQRIAPYIGDDAAETLADLEMVTGDDDPGGENFDLGCAAYWYAANYHGGQSTDLYRLLTAVDYHPGPLESGPDDSARVWYDAMRDIIGK